MKICGCVMAKNEEKLLPGCLESLKHLTDCIIVVDNGSTDKTQEIAFQYGCLVVESPNTIIDEGRNKYIDIANELKADWIFILDADERITEESAKLARKACENADETILHFKIPWYQYIGKGKFVEIATPSRLVRLNSQMRYDGTSIHSSLGNVISKMGGKASFLYCPIHHLDILCENRTHKKRNVYIEGLETQIESQISIERKAMNMAFLGCEYIAINNYEKAIRIWEKVICLLDMEFKYKAVSYAYLYLAQTYLLIGDITKTIICVEKLLENNSHLSDRAYSVLAQIMLKSNKEDEALEYVRKAMKFNSNTVYAMLNAGTLLQEKNTDEALEYFGKALIRNPFLIKPLIYKKGDRVNPYIFQNLLLPSYSGIFLHMRHCYERLGKKEELAYWNDKWCQTYLELK